jgi:hypothetical protein
MTSILKKNLEDRIQFQLDYVLIGIQKIFLAVVFENKVSKPCFSESRSKRIMSMGVRQTSASAEFECQNGECRNWSRAPSMFLSQNCKFRNSTLIPSQGHACGISASSSRSSSKDQASEPYGYLMMNDLVQIPY